SFEYPVYGLSLDELGYERQPPMKTYAIAVEPTLQATDGQTLGYRHVAIVENWHKRAFTSFHGTHGVWEYTGGPLLPFATRNFRDVTVWASPIDSQELMPLLQRLSSQFGSVPGGPGAHRALGAAVDTMKSHGLDLSRALKANGRGLVWAGVRPGEPIEKSRAFPAET